MSDDRVDNVSARNTSARRSTSRRARRLVRRRGQRWSCRDFRRVTHSLKKASNATIGPGTPGGETGAPSHLGGGRGHRGGHGGSHRETLWGKVRPTPGADGGVRSVTVWRARNQPLERHRRRYRTPPLPGRRLKKSMDKMQPERPVLMFPTYGPWWHFVDW